MRPMRTLLVAGAVLGLAIAGQREARAAPSTHPGTTTKAGKAAVDPRADQLLRKMARDLASAKTLQFDAEHVTEVVTKQGQKIQLLATSRVDVQRPNKLRSDRTGPLADASLYYNGRDLTIYGRRVNMYATAQAPDTIDKAIDFGRDELGLDAPAADLLYTDAYPTLMEDVVSGTYLGLEDVGGRACHHLAYVGHQTDWQIWIEDGPRALPCRYVITSKRVKESPEYTIDLKNWKVDERLPAETFTFTPPRDAVKIDFFRENKQGGQAGRPRSVRGES